MVIGYIGRTRMTNKQRQMIRQFFLQNKVTELVHGGDESDEQVHEIAYQLIGCIVIQPSKSSKKGSFEADRVLPQVSANERSQAIIDRADMIIAVLDTYKEVTTWDAIQYVRKKKKHLFIIFPDGSIIKENFKLLN